MFFTWPHSEKKQQIGAAAEQLYVQAAAVDPTFALAYARASLLNSWFAGSGNYRERTAKARAQAEEALRLSPTLGEADMALGLCLYLDEKKYDELLRNSRSPRGLLPITPRSILILPVFIGGRDAGAKRWPAYDRALSLDPRNASIANFAGNNYLFVRTGRPLLPVTPDALEIEPDYVHPRTRLLCLPRSVSERQSRRGQTHSLENVPARLDSDGEVALTRWDMAMLERAMMPPRKTFCAICLSKSFIRAMPRRPTTKAGTALARGDKESAQRYFTATIPVLEKRVREAPDDPEPPRFNRISLCLPA